MRVVPQKFNPLFFVQNMPKGKLQKFAELPTMPNVFQNFSWQYPKLIGKDRQDIDFKGRWSADYFQNNNPLWLELACGYGEYTMAIAQQNSAVNIIGIDIKGNRLWTGARFLLDNDLKNGAFLRTNINLLPHFFASGEVSEIWLTFPDPQNQAGKFKKRLSSAHFLAIYRQIMPPNGIIHLKTDSQLLYEFTLETIAQEGCSLLADMPDLYDTPHSEQPLLDVKTRYEKLNLSGAKTIKYLKFCLE